MAKDHSTAENGRCCGTFNDWSLRSPDRPDLLAWDFTSVTGATALLTSQELIFDLDTSGGSSSATQAASPADQACFLNPWTQKLESLTAEPASSKDSKPAEAPRKKPSRNTERRRAQNRAA
jgi:hypothetical protein